MFGTLDGLGLLRDCVTLHALHVLHVLHEQERWKYGEWKDGEWRRNPAHAQPSLAIGGGAAAASTSSSTCTSGRRRRVSGRRRSAAACITGGSEAGRGVMGAGGPAPEQAATKQAAPARRGLPSWACCQQRRLDRMRREGGPRRHE
jgi:hypothetical protein